MGDLLESIILYIQEVFVPNRPNVCFARGAVKVDLLYFWFFIFVYLFLLEITKEKT